MMFSHRFRRLCYDGGGYCCSKQFLLTRIAVLGMVSHHVAGGGRSKMIPSMIAAGTTVPSTTFVSQRCFPKHYSTTTAAITPVRCRCRCLTSSTTAFQQYSRQHDNNHYKNQIDSYLFFCGTRRSSFARNMGGLYANSSHCPTPQHRRWRTTVGASDATNKNPASSMMVLKAEREDQQSASFANESSSTLSSSSSSLSGDIIEEGKPKKEKEKAVVAATPPFNGDPTSTSATSTTTTSPTTSTNQTDSVSSNTHSATSPPPPPQQPSTSFASLSSSWSLRSWFVGYRKWLIGNRGSSGLSQRFRRIAGDLLIAQGFGASSAVSLWSSNAQDFQQIKDNLLTMLQYLETSEIEGEIRQVMAMSPGELLDQIILLSRTQNFLLQGLDPRDDLLATTNTTTTMTTTTTTTASSQWNDNSLCPIVEEALRYAKYTVSAYGDLAIQAAQMDLTGQIHETTGDNNTTEALSASFWLWGGEETDLLLEQQKQQEQEQQAEQVLRSRISKHISVPATDIALLDVSYSGSTKHLRHFVAIDHVHRKVVLSIRGTFSLSELVVDVVAFSRKKYYTFFNQCLKKHLSV